MLDEIHDEKQPKIFLVDLPKTLHLWKLFFVIRALSNINGIFSLLIFYIKLGQISESTNDAMSGRQFLKKFSIKKLKS